MAMTMQSAVGVLLIVVALVSIALASIVVYSPQNTITTTTTYTISTQVVSFKGNWGGVLFATSITIMLSGIAGVFLLLGKPKPAPAKSDQPGKQSVA